MLAYLSNAIFRLRLGACLPERHFLDLLSFELVGEHAASVTTSDTPIDSSSLRKFTLGYQEFRTFRDEKYNR